MASANPYCTAADLRANISGLTTDNTKAPEAFLTAIAERNSAHIDAMICGVYALPITSDDHPKSFCILQEICINLCRTNVAAKLGISVSFVEGVKQIPTDMMLASQAKKILEQIKDGKYKLPDAPECGECDVVAFGYYDTDEVNGIPFNERPSKDKGGRRIRDVGYY